MIKKPMKVTASFHTVHKMQKLRKYQSVSKFTFGDRLQILILILTKFKRIN